MPKLTPPHIDTPGFDAIAKSMQAKAGGFLAHIPAGWRQGRTAYGGLTAGLALEAASRSFTELPPLRSAAINFIGPVLGDALFTASLLRRGRNVTTIKVVGTLDGGEKDGAVIADIVFVFGINRKSELTLDMMASPCPAPAQCPPFTPEAMRGAVPGFFNRFETQLIDGARPMAGASEGYIPWPPRGGVGRASVKSAPLGVAGEKAGINPKGVLRA